MQQISSPRVKNQEWAHLSTNSNLDGLEVLHAHYVQHRFAPHVHDEYAIGVIEDGIEKLGVGSNKPLRITAGSVVTLNPGEIHDGHADSERGWTYRMLYPSVKLVRSISEEILGNVADTPYFPDAALRDRALFLLIQSTHRVLMCRTTSRLEKQTRLFDMLGLLISRYGHQRRDTGRATQNHARILRAIEYIDAHYDEPIALDTIARIAGLSRFHFCRAFKKVAGIPPHTYQTHRRIEQSKKLIKAGVPLASIAAETGFFDQSHLGRHFKRIVGVSPGVYAA